MSDNGHDAYGSDDAAGDGYEDAAAGRVGRVPDGRDSDGADAGDEDYHVDAEDEDAEEEEEDEGGDDDDDDYDGARGGKRKPQPAAKGQRKRARFVDEDDDEDDGSDEEDEEEEEDYAPTGRPSGSRRQAAAKASSRLKDKYDDDDDDEDDEDDEDADAALARQLNEQLNGLRARPRKTATASGGASTSSQGTQSLQQRRGGGGGGGGGGGKLAAKARLKAAARPKPRKPPARSSGRGGGNVSYAEEDDDDDSDGSDAAERARARKATVDELPAFDDGTGSHDDEVDRVLAHRDIPGLEANPHDPWATRELWIKWKRFSYIHCSWDTRTTLAQLGGFKRVLNYIKKVDDAEMARKYCSREEQEMADVERQLEQQLVEEHMEVERVVAERPGTRADPTKRYLVKWRGLPYVEATWETLDDVMAHGGERQVDLFLGREARLLEPCSTVQRQRELFKRNATKYLEKQPGYLSFGTLRDYQLEGLNWLVYSWAHDRNVILADEMGLGKTIQCVSFVAYLAETLQLHGPFLIVVPLSTIPNWIREFGRWAPFVNTVVYVGDSKSREVIRAFEFDTGRKGSSQPQRFEVLLTTYEVVLKDAGVLGRVRWNYLIVDEAHRLKNADSALYQELAGWYFKNKLLVTGTPLQNSLKELWALMAFLEPSKFPDLPTFEAEYSLDCTERVAALHSALRPHLLRRVIKDVERSLPPKNERILRVEMSPLQRQYYKWILTRNFKELNKGAKGSGQVSLLNIITELKKCCNHPFLFESAEEGYRGSESDVSAVDRLIVTSGKMVLLDKLLTRLKATGHRVLIFSQMVRVLDVISDYMRLRGHVHQRLDGSTPAQARHQAMEHFNKPDSADFAFLLSTRAGGLGINLATADTVIIFDSDWNPQNDLQAMSRAHRIGQTETVNIYRFVTSGSVEEDILERAKRKMVLDHLVIQRMDTSGRTVLDPTGRNSAKQMFGKDELAAILRFGAEELFKRDEQEAAAKEKAMYEEDIDAILERAEVVGGSGEELPPAGGELLSSFNVATFRNEEDDASFWNRLVPVEMRPKDEAEEELLPRTARLKLEAEARAAAAGEGGAGEEGGGAAAPGAGGSKLGRNQRRSHAGEARPKKPAAGSSEPGPPVDGAALRVDEWLLDVDEQGHPTASRRDVDNAASGDDDEPSVSVRTISRRDANAFVRAVRRYGTPARLADIAAEVGPSLEEAPPGARLSLWRGLMDGCRRAVQQGAEDVKDAILDFFGAAVKAQELLSHVALLKLLHKRVEGVAEPLAQFKLEAAAQLSVPKWGKPLGWTPRDDAMLLLGTHYHGLGHWERIAADARLGLATKLGSAAGGGGEKGGAAAAAAAAAAAVGGATDSTDPAVVGAAAAAGTEAAEAAGAADGAAPGATDAAGGSADGGKAGDKLPKGSHLETRVLGLLRKMQSLTHDRPPAAPRAKPAAPKVPRQPTQPLDTAALLAAESARPGFPAAGADASGAAAASGLPPKQALKRKFAAKEPAGGAAPGGSGPTGGDAPRNTSPVPPGGSFAAASASAGRDGDGGAGPSAAPAEKKRKVGDGPAVGGASAGGGGNAKPPKAPTHGAALVSAGGSLSKDRCQALLEEVSTEVKKLKKLQAAEDLDRSKVVEYTKKYLDRIGQHVDKVAPGGANERVRQQLWAFVSEFTRNAMTGDKLMAIYNKLKGAGGTSAAAGPGAGAPGAGAAPPREPKPAAPAAPAAVPVRPPTSSAPPPPTPAAQSAAARPPPPPPHGAVPPPPSASVAPQQPPKPRVSRWDVAGQDSGARPPPPPPPTDATLPRGPPSPPPPPPPFPPPPLSQPQQGR